jgi:DNA-binding LytR/AlgR family response regulator
MKTYLLDDDEIHLLYLESKLQAFANIEIIGKQTDAQLAIAEIETLCAEILFLDIDLITHNGLELYRSLHHKPILVLVTSQLNYAIDGYDLDAVDYLVKPYTSERLQKTIAKLERYTQQQLQMPKEKTQLSGDYMFVKDGNQLHKIKFDDVLYIEALGDFSEIHLQNKTKKIALVNLKYLELQLPSDKFLRISRTIMIHIQSITSVVSTSVFLENLELSIGKSYSDVVKNKIVANHIIKRNV